VSLQKFHFFALVFTLFPIRETAMDAVTTVFENKYICYLQIYSNYPCRTFRTKQYDPAAKTVLDWRNRFLNICDAIF
jgi:hypothetical protein